MSDDPLIRFRTGLWRKLGEAKTPTEQLAVAAEIEHRLAARAVSGNDLMDIYGVVMELHALFGQMAAAMQKLAQGHERGAMTVLVPLVHRYEASLRHLEERVNDLVGGPTSNGAAADE